MTAASRIPKLQNSSSTAMSHWFDKMYVAGLLFHPDDAPETIHRIDSGERTFTDEECNELRIAIDTLFEHHGDAVYECGLRFFHKAMSIKPDYSEALA